jgi:hypothetical protein
MTLACTRWSSRFGLLAALTVLLLALSPVRADAGVATYGAVLLDPYDITPGIGFDHDRYGCNDGCGGCDRGCGRHHGGCNDGCHRPRCADGCHRARCAEDCGRPRCEDRCGDARCEDRCGDDTPCEDRCGARDCSDHCGERDCTDHCGGQETRPADFVPCTGRCSDTEHWEHRWRNGDQVGEEWYDRGRRERDVQGGHPPQWYGRSRDWHDGDDEDAPPPAPSPPTAH